MAQQEYKSYLVRHGITGTETIMSVADYLEKSKRSQHLKIVERYTDDRSGKPEKTIESRAVTAPKVAKEAKEISPSNESA
jgi:hypothetical protein